MRTKRGFPAVSHEGESALLSSLSSSEANSDDDVDEERDWDLDVRWEFKRELESSESWMGALSTLMGMIVGDAEIDWLCLKGT